VPDIEMNKGDKDKEMTSDKIVYSSDESGDELKGNRLKHCYFMQSKPNLNVILKLLKYIKHNIMLHGNHTQQCQMGY
jgi:hypothetical protein